MKSKSSNQAYIIRYGLALVVCFFISHRLFVNTPGRLEQCCSFLVYPFLAIQNVVVAPFKSFTTWFTSNNELIQKVHFLQQKNEALQAELIASKSTKNFASEITDVYDFAKRYDMEYKVLARILYMQTGDEHFILLNVGKQKNITKNMVVIYKNCLVGKVTDVYQFYSKAVLITDPTCQIASYCETTKTVGIYQGMHNIHTALLTHVDHLAKLKIGDRIISSGDGLVFPRGFAIGEIETFKDTGIHYDVKVRPLIDVTQLSYCYVVQKGALT